MKVQNVEVVRTLLDLGEHRQMGGHVPRQLLV